jgi:DNA helicase-2/ATP-dependent DNA helicase PcrA
LEFPRVFVTGLEDRLFPLAYDDEADIEEERRLFYVATTRARQQLTLTHARRRRRFGSWEDGVESRFLREIDRKYLEIAEGYSPPRNFGTSTHGLGSVRSPDPMPNYEDMSQEPGGGLRAGQKVRHVKFGVGKVMKVDGEGEAMRVEVVFGDNIRRVLMMKFAKLEPAD